MGHRITWHGTGGKARNPPNPNYPDGIDVGFTPRGRDDLLLACTDGIDVGFTPRGRDDLTLACKVRLPYPADGIGHWIVTCEDCDQTVGCTAAGRPDDPRSITVICETKRPPWDKSGK